MFRKEAPEGVADEVAVITQDLSDACYELETVRDLEEAARIVRKAKKQADILAKRMGRDT